MSTSAVQSNPRVMRWRGDLAHLDERDRLPWATPERHREDRTTKVTHFVAIVDDIENFYKVTRLHSSLNYLTPNEFRNLLLTQTKTKLTQTKFILWSQCQFGMWDET